MQSLPRAANSEAVALVHAVYFGRARALMWWVLRVPGVVHQIVRDSEPGVADNKAIWTQCIPHSGILPGEEILLSTDIQRNVLCRLFPERQIQSQLLQYTKCTLVEQGLL